MNIPIPLDLARAVLAAYWAADGSEHDMMQAALAAHLPEIAACRYREVDASVIERVLREVFLGAGWDRVPETIGPSIAAALSDATNGGHWEECDYSAFYSDEAKRGRRRGTYEGRSAVTYERWVPANPDAALLAIVDADTLARLREVAEVTAR